MIIYPTESHEKITLVQMVHTLCDLVHYLDKRVYRRVLVYVGHFVGV